MDKFKDQEALQKAYESLEKEFTRRSQRLRELQGKIEQGTLIELNDKLIGENVYGIQQDTTGKYWFDDDENIVLGFTSDGIVTWNNSHGYNDWFKNGLCFLSREEAEKRLEEIQNG